MRRRGKRSVGFVQSEPGLERGRTIGAGAREKEPEPGARTRKMQSEPGLERGRTFGAGAREKESEPGGPNSEDGVGAGAREKIDAVRNMSMKRRRD